MPSAPSSSPSPTNDLVHPPYQESTQSSPRHDAFEYRGEALAPMVRASTLPLRALALQYGADFCYTEELVDKSLLQTVRVENTELGTIDYIKQYNQHQPTTPACDADAVANSSGSTTLGSHKKKKKQSNNNHNNHSTRAPALLLRIDPVLERHRLVCQLGTGDAETAVRAALHVHQDVSAIDINMGCPKPFSVGGGMGSALLQDPERACRIVTSLVSSQLNLGNHHRRMPISAKIRLLPGGIQPTVDFVTGLVNAGVTAVTIHGRYVGTPEPTAADWDVLRQVTVLCKSKFPTTAILVNGDFYTRHEFTEFQQSTGADGVVLARPALYNTSIFVKPNSSTSTMSDTTTTTTPPMYSYDSPLLRDPSVVVQDYLRHAVRYQANYKNIKYVVCEMRNLRRHPTDRVPYLAAASKNRIMQPSSMPTIGQVCNCHSLSDICQLWNVDYAAAEQQNQHKRRITHDLAGEHTYSDAYLLQPSVVSETATSGKRARVECAASQAVSSER